MCRSPLAADHVVAREDVVLNPYYQHMGGLYGSEYWTYLLPRRVGAELAAQLTATFTAVGTRRAVEIGLLDSAFGDSAASFRSQVQGLAERLARHPELGHWLAEKRRAPARDEQVKPLSAYRSEELARSHECFFGADRSYHEARRRFVYKLGAPCAVPVVTASEPVFVANTSPAPEPAVATTPVAEPIAAAPVETPASVEVEVEAPAEIGWRLVSAA